MSYEEEDTYHDPLYGRQVVPHMRGGGYMHVIRGGGYIFHIIAGEGHVDHLSKET